MATNNIENIIENKQAEVQNETNPENTSSKYYRISITMITLNWDQCFLPNITKLPRTKLQSLDVFDNELFNKTINSLIYISDCCQVTLRKYISKLLQKFQKTLLDFRLQNRNLLNNLAEKLKHNDHTDMKIFKEYLNEIENINKIDNTYLNIINEIKEFDFTPDSSKIFKIYQTEIKENISFIHYRCDKMYK